MTHKQVTRSWLYASGRFDCYTDYSELSNRLLLRLQWAIKMFSPSEKVTKSTIQKLILSGQIRKGFVRGYGNQSHAEVLHWLTLDLCPLCQRPIHTAAAHAVRPTEMRIA